MGTYYELVDGIRLPRKVGGHPALEFCNTRTGWGGSGVGEYLKDFDHLAVWAGSVGLLEPERVAGLRRMGARRIKLAAETFERALRFRTSLYWVLRNGAGGSGSSWKVVRDEVDAATASLRLVCSSNETIRWEVDAQPALAAPVLALAWAAGELLTSSDLRFVKACPGARCGWLFLDRRGRRRWCVLATCGNREKARRFAARHGSASAGPLPLG